MSLHIILVYNRLIASNTRSVSTTFNSDRFKTESNAGSFFVNPFQALDGRCATSKYFQIIGSIHDIQSYFGIDNSSSLNVQVFLCHWGHLAITFIWVSRIQFHIGSHGNYQLWEYNPINSIPIAHAMFDPHFALSKITSNISHNGIYNNLLCVGFNSVFHLYKIVITDELLGLCSIGLAFIHLVYLDVTLLQSNKPNQDRSLFSNESKRLTSIVSHTLSVLSNNIGLTIWPFKLLRVYFDLGKQGLNFHSSILIGFISIGWSAHLVHLAIPISRGYNNNEPICKSRSNQFYAANWTYDIASMDKDQNIYSHSAHVGSSTITFFGGLKSNTISFYLTDIAHHHLSLGILFVLSGHVYSSVYKGVDNLSAASLRNDVHIGNPPVLTLIVLLSKSLHLELSLGCAILSIITSVVGEQISVVFVPYVYLCYDYITTVALYVHHEYIASTLMMATVLHASISFITDYGVLAIQKASNSVIYKMKGQLNSHLSWMCLYLGFHTLGVYVHNDTVSAFGEFTSEILIEPLFGMSFSTRFKVSSPLGPGDLLFHHAIGLGLHVSILILLKGSLDAPGSHLIPDKINFAVSFPCDGPIRGGTCDISAFDSFYLALFWMLNTHGWITFYFHWKHL
jgi:photosystem I P700 chlorophyll a apoprotein A2